MDNLSLVVDKYADDVLRACLHYLGNMTDAESAFEEVFSAALRMGVLTLNEDIFPELLFITRKICIADTIRDDNEEKFLQSFFGLSKRDAEYVMGYRTTRIDRVQRMALNL